MKWQKEGVAYQIYPRSFMDSNGDGIGDLRGIISKLDYLKELGIDIIWLSPIYASPNDDNGYDISDYEDIMPEFGTMKDFMELLSEVHKRDMKLIMDLVINHTSDEHPWFMESRLCERQQKREWYIWRKGKAGKEPNNWESIFGGSAWEYDALTDTYYLHLFSKKMPDLNWENETLRQTLYEMINRWIDKGVDGFRVDAISHIKKSDYEDLPNEEGKNYVPSFSKHMNQEGIHEFLKELKENTFSKHDLLTVGEGSGVEAEEATKWVGQEGIFDMLFQFEHICLWKNDSNYRLELVPFKEALSNWQTALDKDGWNALFIENHDLTRIVSRMGDEKNYWKQSAKALALIYFMQKGTPFIYQGQELGMTNTYFSSIDDYKDDSTITRYYERIEEGMTKEESLSVLQNTTRDNARSPMQWDHSEHAGFSTGLPWMKVNSNYRTINVKEQQQDDDSIYHFYKKLIILKKQSQTLLYGQYELLLPEHPHIYAYTRTLGEEQYIIIANLSSQYEVITRTLLKGKLIIGNYNEIIEIEETKATKATEEKLRPYEARLYLVNSEH